MRSVTRNMLTLVVLSLLLLVVANVGQAQAQGVLPNPVLYMTGQEYYQAGGRSFVRYRYAVLNHDAYPNTLFASSPQFAPVWS